METWKLIPSLPAYLASSEGRVMVVPTIKPMPHGGVRHYGGEPTHGVLSEGRYGFCYNGKNYRVHRLVCEAFNGPAPGPDQVVMHLDENALNNRPENLQWGTQSENLRAPGFLAFCRRRGKAAPKITEDQAKEVKYGGGSCKAVATKFGISASTVSNIRAGRSWRHL